MCNTQFLLYQQLMKANRGGPAQQIRCVTPSYYYTSSELRPTEVDKHNKYDANTEFLLYKQWMKTNRGRPAQQIRCVTHSSYTTSSEWRPTDVDQHNKNYV